MTWGIITFLHPLQSNGIFLFSCPWTPTCCLKVFTSSFPSLSSGSYRDSRTSIWSTPSPGWRHYSTILLVFLLSPYFLLPFPKYFQSLFPNYFQSLFPNYFLLRFAHVGCCLDLVFAVLSWYLGHNPHSRTFCTRNSDGYCSWLVGLFTKFTSKAGEELFHHNQCFIQSKSCPACGKTVQWNWKPSSTFLPASVPISPGMSPSEHYIIKTVDMFFRVCSL